MQADRLGIFRAPTSDERFIIEVMGDGTITRMPLHITELAADEAKNLLRHYNLSDSEIDGLLASAEPRAVAEAFAAGE